MEISHNCFPTLSVGMLLALTGLGFAAEAAVPVPGYSFKYGTRTVSGDASQNIDARLKVTVEKTEYPAFDATEWVLWFENPSAEKSEILSEIKDGDFIVALPPFQRGFAGDNSRVGDRAVITMNGCTEGGAYDDNDFQSSHEFRTKYRYFHARRAEKPIEVQNHSGRSSDGEAPFFEVNEKGRGAVIAFGWTGDWKATFLNETRGVRVQTGLRNARFYLEPGEKLRTGRVLVMNYTPGEDSGNKFRRLIRSHFSHLSHGGATREGIFANELWGGLTSDEMTYRLKKMQSHGITFEDIWIDAGWYGNSQKCDDAYTGDWSRWTGDWVPNPRVHPDGLTDVRDVAKATGAGLMLWLEPERVVQSSNFAKEHPELLLGKGYTRILDYGKPAARRHIVDLISDLAKKLNFSCYRQDFNTALTGFFADNDAPDRRGITEIRHITGLYQVWDEILARNPGLLIDNCASGGRRLDIETLRRTVFFFRSDFQCGFNANADVMQTHNVGLARLIPLAGCTTKLSDLYSLRSAYSTSFGAAYWNAIWQPEEKVDWAAGKKSHDEYLKIRKYFSRDFYNHGSMALDDGAWAIWQYHDPETNEGIVMAFRRAGSPCDRAKVVLKGVPGGLRLVAENLDTGAKTSVTGELEITLPERRSSTIFRYAPEAGPQADWSGLVLRGETVEGKVFYAAGEKMTFRFRPFGKAMPDGDWWIRWVRTGDDGKVEEGRAALPKDGAVEMTTALDRPGFVRVEAFVTDAAGRDVVGKGNPRKKVFFDGGAGVSPERLQPPPEPENFDAWWRAVRAELPKVPMNPRLKEHPSGRADVKLFAFELDSPAGPCTGWLSVPTAPGKYPLRVKFFGYNESWEPRATAVRSPRELSATELRLWVSPHGFEQAREAAYYKELRQKVGGPFGGHAWDPTENASPDTAYFKKMAWRVLRALGYAKTRPEWDGRTLVVTGGSQGALQSVWAASQDPAVTAAEISIVWNCDAWGKAKEGRLIGDWALPWAEGLRYFDAVTHATRIPASCRVTVGYAGLGDYISPPSGIAAFYNALRGPKSINWVQGGEHGWCPSWPDQQKVSLRDLL